MTLLNRKAEARAHNFPDHEKHVRHIQAHRGGTSLDGIVSELFFKKLFLLQLVSFTVDSDPLGGVDRNTHT